MKKTYRLDLEGKNRDRLLEAAKHDTRKYVRREQRRELPEGVDFWDFNCRFGLTAETAEVAHLSALTGLMDVAAGEGKTGFYVEIVTCHGHRKPRPSDSAEPADPADEPADE